jgi:hypothetical protein
MNQPNDPRAGISRRIGAGLLAFAIAVGGALFVDVESDAVKNGVWHVMTYGFSGPTA